MSVHPRFAARLQAAKAYAETIAGPMKADIIEPSCCAVPAVQTPALDRLCPAACNALLDQARSNSDLDGTETAIVRDSGMMLIKTPASYS